MRVLWLGGWLWMSEHAAWTHMRNGMRGKWLAQRHEDKISIGIPDVSYSMPGVNGWIEIESIQRWPKKPLDIVKVKHFSDTQRVWLKRRGEMGGYCFALLKVNQEYLLFDAYEDLGKRCRDTLLRSCRIRWPKGINFKQLEKELTTWNF
jgi:hypothetical protein|tara:strand:+ start:9674 stop:10120 length:447 start_codon:yes stop_codon:yes gene_type:complete